MYSASSGETVSQTIVKNMLNQVDLAFVVDTTGSMGPFIQDARQQMKATIEALTASAQLALDLRVGLIEYRDHPPQEPSFVVRAHRFTTDLKRVERTIRRLRARGGGDGPEAVFDGLRAACEDLDWRPHSRRLALLVGDAPPHGAERMVDAFPDGCPCGLTLESTTALLEGHRIVLYALGLTRHTRRSFSDLAMYTGGRYYEAGQEVDAIEAITTVLAAEFGDMAFDREVWALCAGNPDWTIDLLCEALESTPGRVAASLSRLSQRNLLGHRR